MRVAAFCVGVFLMSPVVLGRGVGRQTAPPSQTQKEATAAQAQASRSNYAENQSTQATEQEAQAGPGNKKDDAERNHKFRVRLGTISVGAGYSHFSGPFYYPYGLYGFHPYSLAYSPFLWDPFWSNYTPFYYPGYFQGFAYGNGKGEVKLMAEPKTADVYLDGAYAGTADRLKSMWLEAGAYDLSVSTKDRATFRQRIYVLSGKSLKITAKLVPEKTEEKP
jgi:hypothetical protein